MADTIDRLTLFPQAGNRVMFSLKSYRVEGGVLHFTDLEGHTFQTTLPFALETGIPLGHKYAPFAQTEKPDRSPARWKERRTG